MNKLFLHCISKGMVYSLLFFTMAFIFDTLFHTRITVEQTLLASVLLGVGAGLRSFFRFYWMGLEVSMFRNKFYLPVPELAVSFTFNSLALACLYNWKLDLVFYLSVLLWTLLDLVFSEKEGYENGK